MKRRRRVTSASTLPVATEASLTASPNPVAAGEGKGKTTITWQTGDDMGGEVYLSIDGAQERLFARSKQGSAAANWIIAGPTYEFRLYGGREHNNVLARVTVTRNKS